MNKVNLSGRVGHIKRIKTMENRRMVKFWFAVNTETEIDWIPCVLRDNHAVLFEKYFCKGDEININGRIRSCEYTDADGEAQWDMMVEILGMDIPGKDDDK